MSIGLILGLFVLAAVEPTDTAAVAPPDVEALIRQSPKVEFVEIPTGADMQRAYPTRALEANGVTGLAVVDCVIGETGRFENCRVLKEEPQGYDFGQGALRAALKFRVKTTAPDGTSLVGRHVARRILWSLS